MHSREFHHGLLACGMSQLPEIPEELLREVCDRHGIPKGDEFLVVDGVRKRGAPGACCGSNCRPCILDVEDAVEELRQLLATR